MNVRTLVWGVIAVVTFSGAAWSQSLADVARKEEERRKAVKTPAKVYTNEDLRKYPVTPPPETPSPDAGKVEPTEARAAAGAATSPAKEAEPSADLGESYWRGLITEARGALTRSGSYLEALQIRANTLTAEFYAREDPVQRSAIWTQRTRVMDDIERLKQDMAEQEKAIAGIEADARKANVPPGWIR